MKTAVCGIGNMGKRYAFYLQDQKIRGLELQALTRIRPADREMFAPFFQNGVQVYESAGSLLDSIEAGKEQIGELADELHCTEAEYRYTSKDSFRKIKGIWHTMEAPAQTDPYIAVMQAFADEANGTGHCIAPGSEGRKSLLLANAIALSSWQKRMIHLPGENTEEEKEFERIYEENLNRKAAEGSL